MKPTSPMIGKAGELRVRAELIIRGFSPAVCDFDGGVDIILAHSGKRIQVKTCTKPNHSPASYSYKYTFGIHRSQVRNNGDGTYKRLKVRSSYTDVADYIVLWAIEHDIFYIIPEEAVGERVSIVVPTPTEDRKYRINERKSKSKYEKYRDAWYLLA